MPPTPKWYESITNIVLLIMILTLCSMTMFATIVYNYERFDYLMTIFGNIMIAITSFFFGKSTLESANKKASETEKSMTDAALAIPGATPGSTTSTTTLTSTETTPKEEETLLTV